MTAPITLALAACALALLALWTIIRARRTFAVLEALKAREAHLKRLAILRQRRAQLVAQGQAARSERTRNRRYQAARSVTSEILVMERAG